MNLEKRLQQEPADKNELKKSRRYAALGVMYGVSAGLALGVLIDLVIPRPLSREEHWHYYAIITMFSTYIGFGTIGPILYYRSLFGHNTPKRD